MDINKQTNDEKIHNLNQYLEINQLISNILYYLNKMVYNKKKCD